MGVPRKNPLTSLLLEVFNSDTPMLPLESVYDFARRRGLIGRRKYRDSIKGLRSRGIIEIVKKKDKEFLRLTKKGALRILLNKSKSSITPPWDGKWRVISFDIPEEFYKERNKFRRLLRHVGFVKLQSSVFISPYPISQDAVRYWEKINLIKYIRIMKIEKMDNDKDLRKHFNLKSNRS